MKKGKDLSKHLNYLQRSNKRHAEWLKKMESKFVVNPLENNVLYGNDIKLPTVDNTGLYTVHEGAYRGGIMSDFKRLVNWFKRAVKEVYITHKIVFTFMFSRGRIEEIDHRIRNKKV